MSIKHSVNSCRRFHQSTMTIVLSRWRELIEVHLAFSVVTRNGAVVRNSAVLHVVGGLQAPFQQLQRLYSHDPQSSFMQR